MYRYVTFFILLIIFFISCSNDDKPPANQRSQQEDSDNPVDTNLTPEEKFSSAIMFDFLNGSEDEDLADFLETTIYKMSLGYSGMSIVEISPAVWFLTFEKEGSSKNYLIQKFVDIKSNDYYFHMNETSLTITDIISRKGSKVSAE